MPNTKLVKQKGSKFWRLFIQKDGKYKVEPDFHSSNLFTAVTDIVMGNIN